MKMALRRLRRFTREGAKDELDLDETITRTARNAGYLDIAHRAERRNRIKVLLLLDVGGSMDDHVRSVEQLFSAARTEFKHLETYFHNCPYERMWRSNKNGREGLIDTRELLRTFNRLPARLRRGCHDEPLRDHPAGGRIYYWNAEAGSVWMQRIVDRLRGRGPGSTPQASAGGRGPAPRAAHLQSAHGRAHGPAEPRRTGARHGDPRS